MPEAPTSPEPEPDLDKKEKAKMDYQAELAAKSISCGGTKWKEIMWDKGLTAIFVVALGTIFSISLGVWQDSNRDRDARQRFVSEKRFDALTELGPILNSMQGAYFDIVGKTPEELKAADGNALLAKFKTAADKAYEAATNRAFLFDAGFAQDTERYIVTYLQLAKIPLSDWAAYKSWAGDMGIEADVMANASLLNSEIPPQSRMTLEPITAEERHKMTPKQYVDRQFNYWLAHRKRH